MPRFTKPNPHTFALPNIMQPLESFSLAYDVFACVSREARMCCGIWVKDFAQNILRFGVSHCAMYFELSLSHILLVNVLTMGNACVSMSLFMRAST